MLGGIPGAAPACVAGSDAAYRWPERVTPRTRRRWRRYASAGPGTAIVVIAGLLGVGSPGRAAADDTPAGLGLPALGEPYSPMYLPGGWLMASTMLSTTAPSAESSTRSASTIVQQEQSRVFAVIDKYPRYRWAAGVFGLAALSILALSRQPWSHGVAAGLLLLVVAQVIIDHYSERRARAYLDEITSSARKH